MNRGLQFFVPTSEEWSEYNEKVFNRRTDPSSTTVTDERGHSSSGVYVLANSMPGFVLNLTRPNLNWCVDSNLLRRHETKINVGSGYFVMDRCILGPRVCCWDASVDRRANTYVESFAKEVSDGLCWILQIYRTTNIMQQHDLFNTDLAVAKNIRNKLAFGGYTPVRLVAPLREDTDCEEVPMSTTGDSPLFVQPFGFSSGSTAPIGGVGQFTRPYLGAAPVNGFCSISDTNSLAVQDPYVLGAEDVRRLNEMISKNREEMANRSYGIFTPSSGLSDTTNVHSGNRATVTTRTPVTGETRSVNVQQDAPLPPVGIELLPPLPPQSPITGVPGPSDYRQFGSEDYTDVIMGDFVGQE